MKAVKNKEWKREKQRKERGREEYNISPFNLRNPWTLLLVYSRGNKKILFDSIKNRMKVYCMQIAMIHLATQVCVMFK